MDNLEERVSKTFPVVVVDDEAQVRETVRRYLIRKGYDCNGLSGVDAAEAVIKARKTPMVVISDLKMPGRTGLDLLRAISSEPGPDLAFIVMTGYGGMEDAISALRLGAEDFLTKPVDLEHVAHVVGRAQETLSLRRMKVDYYHQLEADVAEKTSEIQGLLDDLETAYSEVVKRLAIAAEYKDPETGAHTKRIGFYANELAARLDWDSHHRAALQLAAPLHDLGKIGTPDAVLLKPGRLTDEEMVIMKRHSEIGAEILSGSDHPVMVMAANIAIGHHERWDGTGYPHGVKGEDIPVEARITALCDVYDALRSIRPYKPAISHDEAVQIILKGDGRTQPGHFDPQLLAVFERVAAKLGDIFDELAD